MKRLGLTPAQQKARRKVLGGTDAAAILGLSKTRGPWDVFAEKHGWLPPPAPGDEMPEDAMWGLLLEPVIATEYTRRTGVALRRSGLVRHPDRPWQAGHPDRLAPDRGLEVKVRRSDSEWGEPGSDEVPPAVKIQTEHYLAVTSKPRWDIGVLFRGARMEIYTVHANPAILQDLTEEEGEWWRRHVVLGVEPDYDGSPGASAYLRRQYPVGNGETLVAMPHQYALLDEFSKVRARKAFYERQEATMQQTLMGAMGAAEALKAPGLTIRLIRPKPGEKVDWPAYAAALEGLVEEVALGSLPVGMDPLEARATLKGLYTTERPGRPQFRVYEKKENRIA